jgi:hypothetical protein
MELLITFGLVLFGIVLYAVVTVWKKVGKLQEFDFKKFIKDNKLFWIVSVVLGFLLSLGMIHIDGFKDVAENLGFAVNGETQGGFVLLGIALGAGSDKSKVTGEKKLVTSNK